MKRTLLSGVDVVQVNDLLSSSQWPASPGGSSVHPTRSRLVEQLVDHGQHGLAGFLDGFDQIQLVVGEFANVPSLRKSASRGSEARGFRRSCATMPRRRFLAVLAALNCVTSCLCCSGEQAVLQVGAEACERLTALEGLGQVVDTSGSEPFHHVVGFGLGRNEDNRGESIAVPGTKRAQVSKPVMPA